MDPRAQNPQPGAEAAAVAAEPARAAELSADIAAAKSRIEAGDLEGGLAAFRRIAENHPQIPEVFNNLGAICAAMGRRDEAEEAFGRALALTPEAPNPWYNRGLMRFQGGNNLGALEDFQQAAGLDPRDAEFPNNMGVVHFQLREWEHARQAFERALSIRPDYLAAHLNLVDVDLAEGEWEQAHARARALAARSDEAEIQLKLVECSIQLACSALDQAGQDCDAAAQRVDPSLHAALREQRGHILEAKQALIADPSAGNPAD